jgi:hypothetical protein
LLSILPHNRGRGFQPDADTTSIIDIGALGGNSPDDILGSQYRRHSAPPCDAAGSGLKPFIDGGRAAFEG